MSDAVADLKNDISKKDDTTNTSGDNISNIGVSVDGAWTKRGFSSMSCVVTAMSIDNGKIIDVEAMSIQPKRITKGK